MNRVGKEKDWVRKRKQSVISDDMGGDDVRGEILIFGEINGKFFDIWLDMAGREK